MVGVLKAFVTASFTTHQERKMMDPGTICYYVVYVFLTPSLTYIFIFVTKMFE